MGGVGCVGLALARVWAGMYGCTGECGGHFMLWLNPKLMSRLVYCTKFVFVKLIVMLVYNTEGYSVILVTS
jgi:hypothetical protein